MVLHAIHGRVRLSVAQLKRSPEKALQLQQQLAACEGISRAVANPATGTVLVEYDATRSHPEQVMRELRRLGWIRRGRGAAHRNAAPAAPGMKQRVAESLTASVLEVAVRGLVSALL
jgi:hypothetical protein